MAYVGRDRPGIQRDGCSRLLRVCFALIVIAFAVSAIGPNRASDRKT